MITGINFGCENHRLPQHKVGFKDVKIVDIDNLPPEIIKYGFGKPYKEGEKVKIYFSGACDTLAEVKAMWIMANNGRRSIFILERSPKKGGHRFGFYIN